MRPLLHKHEARGSTKGRIRSMYWVSFVFACLLSYTASYAGPAMSGTYTVCASGCSYSNVNNAVADLKANGVSGPVIIKIAAGDYNTSIAIRQSISGASATNTITFQGTGSKASSGYTRFYKSDTALALMNTSYILVKDIKFECTASGSGYAAYLYYASNFQLINCNFVTATGYNYGLYPIYEYYCTKMKMDKSRAYGGYYTMYRYRSSSATNDTIQNSTIIQGYYYGIYNYYGNSDYFYNNHVDTFTSYQYMNAIYDYGESSSKYMNNTIISYYGAEFYYNTGNEYANNTFGNMNQYYGAYMYLQTAPNIHNNKFYASGYGCYMGYPNYAGTGSAFNFVNNFLASSGYYALYCYDYNSYSNINAHFLHNTFYMSGSNYAFYVYNYYGSHGWDIRNNNFYNASSGIPFYFMQMNNTDQLSGNNYYVPSGTLANINSTSYTSISALQTGMSAYGLSRFDQSVSTSFVNAPTDLHYTASSTLPWGKYAGVDKDFDGDSRCQLFPTSGADEGKPSWGTPTSAFTGPKGTIVEGTSSVFKNGASTSEPKAYKWYVDGKFISDSIDLVTVALKYPSSKVTLVTLSCGGKDSLTKTFSIDTPKKAPVTDFISNKNVIRAGEVVKFNDLSLNYPSTWTWSITPKAYLNGTTLTPTYKYTAGDTFKPNVSIRFDVPGKYKVCLATSNRRGAGNTECKADYITVLGSYNMTVGSSPTPITDAKGYLYDNGGPNANYTYNSNGYSTLLMPSCAKTVYLVFNYFNIYCGYDFIRIWDGKDNSSKSTEITTCTSNIYAGVYGPGLTGGPSFTCYTTSVTCIPKTTDTFVAKSGKMYIQMKTNYGLGLSGFEAYFWSDPKNVAPPVASFDADTSTCTNANIDFTSTSTGEDVTYQWFANDDYSYPIDNRANTNYAFIFPGDYDVALVVTNCKGSDTMIKTIHVVDPPTPKVAFHADNTNPTTNDVVYLVPDVKGCVDAYTWTVAKKYGSAKVNYVNGTNNASQLPAIVLSDTGCYDVTLEVENATGSDNVTKSCYIYVKNPYCTPTVDNPISDLGISEVKLNTIDNKSSQTGGYENYTPTVSTNLELGVSYPITISRNTSANSAVRTIYVDWNADGDFTDVGETVATEKSGRSLSWTDTLTVPAYAKQGATVMRIAITQGSQTNDPCSNGYGEYEDYRLYITSDKTKPVITLNGADTIRVEQGYSFTDPGATALDNLSGNITKKIVVTSSEITTGSSFDILTPGTYIFSYNVKDDANNSADTRKRVVIVTPDKTKPDLEVNSSDTVIVGVFTSFTPPTYTANDLVDGDLTSEVKTNINVDVNKVATDTLYYSVTDANGNTATKNIIVYVVDTTAPVVVLTGNNTVYVDVNSAYSDMGVTYTDNYYDSATLAKGLVMLSNVDVTKLGTYTVSYTVTDPSGNKSIIINRTVIVQDTMAPMVTLNGGNTITLEVNNMYADKGLSITDNYYKQFTVDTEGTFYTRFPNGMATKLGTYTVIYKVTDGSGNVTTVIRTINVVDKTPPTISLQGAAAVNICRWASYTDAGYNVSDNYYTGSGITVTMEGSFLKDKTQLTGIYTLRYKAVDSSGNVSYSDYRYINVVQCESGIQNVSDLDKSISIYPNPSEGLFTISADIAQQQEVKITVTNMLGQQIAVLNNQILGNNQIQIDLRGQSAGVYLLNIYTNNQMVTKRITITR